MKFAESNLNLDSALSCFELIPTRKEEKNLIKSLMTTFENRGLIPDEPVYLLPQAWWDTWKAYVSYESEIVDFNASIVGSKPIPINCC